MSQIKIILFSLLVFGSFGVCLLSFTECNVHPKFWCDSVDIAKQCQVHEQCRRHWQRSNSSNTPLVDFTLYYEIYCGDCQQFILQRLKPVYEKLYSIMELTLVPYGKTTETRDESQGWKFDCQHGPDECKGNLIETCAIHYYNNISVYFPFIVCMEESLENPEQAARACAMQSDVPIQTIIDCSKNYEGNALEHQMGLKTRALEPRLTEVPWVTLNGVHIDSIESKTENGLLKLICNTCKGRKPPVCFYV